MKTLVLSPLLLLAVASGAAAAETPTFSGQWKVHNSIAGNESDQDCTFAQKGDAFSGDCKSDQSTVSVTGKIEDKKVSWQYVTDYNGESLTIMYSAPLPVDGKVAGDVLVKEMDIAGDFTATQAK